MYTRLGQDESDRLGIFPVVVEAETWLLAAPTIQRDYIKKSYGYPENERDPADIIYKHIRGYRKGQFAEKYFRQASAEQVYADNCPHFILLADWMAGKLPSTDRQPTSIMAEDTREKIFSLHAKYDALTTRIEANLKFGQTTAAGVLRAEQNYIDRQIRDLLLQLNNPDADA